MDFATEARRRHGNYFDDFALGQVFHHWPGRTITEADNIQFSLLTMNRHPLHCDANFAANSQWGKPLVNSGLTLAIVLGMTVDDVSFNSVANLGWKEIDLTSPVFAGDTVYARSEVVELRFSRSKPGHGLVTVRTEGLKQDGAIFMSFLRSCLVPTRETAGVPPRT
jgi:acyl dehydratase